MIEGDPNSGLMEGLLFLLNGAGAALVALPGRYKLAACVPWAAMLVCLLAFLEGVDGRAPGPNFVTICFVIWALLLAIPFAVAVRRAMTGETQDWPQALAGNSSDVRSGDSRSA